MVEHRVLNPTTTFPRWSRRASIRTPNQSSGRPEADTSCGRPRASSGNRITRLSFNHSQRDCQGDLQVRRTYLQLSWPYHFHLFLFPHILMPNLVQAKQSRRNRNLFNHFPKDPNCEVCRRTKVTRAPCERNPDEGRTEL